MVYQRITRVDISKGEGMNTMQIIDLLIDDDLNGWNSKEDMHDYFANILRKGFIGYEQSFEDEIRQEAIDRGLIDEH
jgi:hypothetical protein